MKDGKWHKKVSEHDLLSDCNECMAEMCAICRHPPCPECLDDCDDINCLVEKESTPSKEFPVDAVFLEKTHQCVFHRCEKHRKYATGGKVATKLTPCPQCDGIGESPIEEKELTCPHCGYEWTAV